MHLFRYFGALVLIMANEKLKNAKQTKIAEAEGVSNCPLCALGNNSYLEDYRNGC